MQVFQYQLLGFSGDNLVYQDDAKHQQKTEKIEDFISGNGWQQLNEKDRRQLLSYVKNKKLTTVEGFKIPLGPTSFNSIFGYKFLPLFVGIFCTLIVGSVLMNGVIELNLLGSFVPAGLFPFILGYIFLDLINEVYGFKQARFAIYSAIFCRLLAGALIQINIYIPHVPYIQGAGATNDQHLAHYLSLPYQMLIGSVAILAADIINIFIFQTLKSFMNNKGLWFRSLVSNSISQFFITTIFFGIFYHSAPNLSDFISKVYILKIGGIICLIPILYLLVWFVRDVQKNWIFSGPKSVKPSM